MTGVDSSLVDLIETAAQAAVQRSLIETVVPIIRHGTVVDTDINTFIHEVQMDGDSTTILAHDIQHLGSTVGARVTVMFAPPHQAMIIGQPIHDQWHQIGVLGEVPFNTGWGNDAATGDLDTNTFPRCSYRQYGSWVELRGGAVRTSGASNTLFTLPVGYRPRNDLPFACINIFAVHEAIVVDNLGQVNHPAGGAGPIFFSVSYSVT